MSNQTVSVSAACTKLLTQLGRTRNTKVIGFLVRAAIARRDFLAGKEAFASAPDLTKITEAKSRKRLEAMIITINTLTERKDISTLCSQAIEQRKISRAHASK